MKYYFIQWVNIIDGKCNVYLIKIDDNDTLLDELNSLGIDFAKILLVDISKLNDENTVSLIKLASKKDLYLCSEIDKDKYEMFSEYLEMNGMNKKEIKL